MRTTIRTLLMFGDSADAVEYLLRDTFESGVWAAGTRDCDVIGQLTVTDSAAVSSITGGKYTYAASTGNDDPGWVSVDSWARSPGLGFVVGGVTETNRNRIGFGQKEGPLVLVTEIAQGIVLVGTESNPGNPLKASASTLYDVAYVLDAAGGLFYIRPAGTGDFVMRWRDNVGTTTPVRVYHGAIGAPAGTRAYGDISVVQDSNSILVNPDINEATPVSAQTYAGTSSAIIDLTVTAPDPLAEQTELRFRVQDDDNYYTAYFDSAGAFKLDRVITGTPTNLINVAAVQAAAGTRRIRVICYGNDIDCWTKSGTTWTKRGGTISSALLAAYSDVIPVVGTGWSVANLRSDKVFDAAITGLLESWLAGN